MFYNLFRRTGAAQNVAPRVFEPSTSRMPDKHRTTRPRLPCLEPDMETFEVPVVLCLCHCFIIISYSLVSDLEDILVESQDYERLLATWKGWRDVTGPKMRSLYKQFVDLSNQGVRKLGEFHP